MTSACRIPGASLLLLGLLLAGGAGAPAERPATSSDADGRVRVGAGLDAADGAEASLTAEAPVTAEAPLTAEAIMRRVAGNQDRAEQERVHYVYVQHARVISRRGKTVMCEEVTDSRITPSASGYHADLLKLDGRLLVKKSYRTYTSVLRSRREDAVASKPGDGSGSKPGDGEKSDQDGLSVSIGDEDTDRDLVENMRATLTSDTSKDGINRKLFPLSTKGQEEYDFHLAGREQRNGREVFHIDFRPKAKGDFGWKGEAYIDATDFEPVVVSTAMARKVPLAVRTLLGTSVPGLGFTIVYAPQPDGVWFPVSLGTEFKLHVLFFFTREILIDAQNRSFEKTHVRSEMVQVGETPE